jgi:rhodanese-related sulfurtransferase
VPSTRCLSHCLALLLVTAPLAAQGPPPPLDAIRQATAKYGELTAALRDGYIHDPTLMCVDAAMVGQPDSLGAMGLHLFQPRLVGIHLPQPVGKRLTGDDAELNWLEPEVLVYEPQADNSLQLVAVEYLVFEQAWKNAGHSGPPMFGNEPFVLMKDDPATARDEAHMLDTHYELHLWVHRENPNGVFKEWNPRVTCANYAARGLTRPDVQAGTWPESGRGAPQLSTDELRTTLRRGDALLLDVRRPRDFQEGHIPGAYGLEGTADAGDRSLAVVATARRMLRMDRTRALVLYGDGVNSDDVRKGASALIAEGFVNVRRYQLGLATWLALGGVMQLDADGLARAWKDSDVTVVDGRETVEAQGSRLPGLLALEVPQVARGAGEGKLPTDLAARLVAVGRDPTQGRALAEELARRGYRHVAFFNGMWRDVVALGAR